MNAKAEEAERLVRVIEREVTHLDVHQRIVLTREIEESLDRISWQSWRGNDFAN